MRLMDVEVSCALDARTRSEGDKSVAALENENAFWDAAPGFGQAWHGRAGEGNCARRQGSISQSTRRTSRFIASDCGA